MGTCSAPILEDVVHPMPGEIWVVSRVCEALVAAGVSGVSFAPVQLSWQCAGANLRELVVHGRAWRVGSTEDTLRLCDLCGRTGFPSPGHLVVDETRWDGADFVHLDGNPNIIVVTERVAAVVESNGFSNLAVVAIPQREDPTKVR